MKRASGIRTALIALPLLLCAFLGCGKDLFTLATGVPSSPTTPNTPIPGNWIISGFYRPTPDTLTSYNFFGSLVNNGGQLSGVFHSLTSCFDQGYEDIPYTGTLDSNNNLSIASSSVDGQVLTFNGKLAADGASITGGSFTILGGCSGTIVSVTFEDGPGAYVQTTAMRLPGITGNWATTAGSSRGLMLTEQLAESSTPDAHGDFALTGPVAVQGSSCFTQGTIQSGSYLTGYIGRQIILMNDGSTLDATLNLSYGSNVTPGFLLTGVISGGNCNGNVTLNLQ